MWILIVALSALAQDVKIAVSRPGIVHVSATGEDVFVPACRGVTWTFFSADSGAFEPTPPAACGPAGPAILIDKNGHDFKLDVPLLPIPKVGFHILQPTVVIGRKCRSDKPFYLAGCEDLEALKGPQLAVRNRGAAAPVEPSNKD